MKILSHKFSTKNSLVKILAFSFFILSLTVLLASGLLHLFFNLSTQQKALRNNQQLIARDAAKTVSNFITEIMSDLETASWVASPYSMTQTEQKEFLQSILGLQPSLRQIILIDEYSKITMRASKISSFASEKDAIRYEKEIFHHISQTKLYLSPVYIDEITSEPMIIMVIPMNTVYNEFKGGVVAEVNLKFMWEVVNNLTIGKTGYAYVVDNEGNLISFGDVARVLQNENVKNVELVSEFINSAKDDQIHEVKTYEGIQGSTVVGTYVPLKIPDWAVIIELPWREAYSGIIIETMIIIGTLLLIAAFITIIGIGLARQISIPITNLMKTASRIAEGERNLNAEIVGPMEVASLAEAFNSMTNQLGKSLNDLEKQIIEVKIAEEALREKSEELDRYFTSALDLLCIADTDGNFRRLNREWQTTLGYAIEELEGQPFMNFVHPDDIEATLKSLAQLSEKKEVLNFINRYRCKNGSYRWIEWRSSPFGKIIYAAARDITEHIEMKEKLLVSQFSIEQSMDAIFWAKKDASLTYVNEAACRSLLYSKEELLKMKLSDIDPLFTEERWNVLWYDTDENNYEPLETIHRRKDGTEFPVEVSSRRISFGDSEFKVASARDITERKKSEQALRTSEAQLSIALRMAHLGHWEYDVKNDEFTFNDLFYSLLRTSVEKEKGYIMTLSRYIQRFAHPDDENIIYNTVKEAKETADVNFNKRLEHRIIYADGKHGYIVVRCFIVKDDHGNTKKIYGVNQDVTERKEVEKELIKSKETAEKSNRLKTEFLAQMSHEIRTPINTILNFSGLLKAEISNKLSDELSESFSIIENAGKRLIRTIDLILNMSQVQTDTFELHFKEVDIYDDVINLLAIEYLKLADKKGIKLETYKATPDTKIKADEYTTIQIFENLLNNAFKYTEKGAVTVKVFNDSDKHLIVEVSDTGIGISDEFQQNLFRPFMQEEGGYTRKYEGNGLGLALVSRYCELNNAKIDVSSKKGVGTKFTVVFNYN